MSAKLKQKITGFSVWIGFHYGLVSVTNAVLPPELSGKPRDVESEAYDQWRRNFRFEKYAKTAIATDGNFTDEERAHQQIDHWIASEGDSRVRILTTKDDFINDPDGDWDIPGVDVIVMPKGSHYGYRSIPWFQDFMDSVYVKKDAKPEAGKASDK